MSNNFYQNEDEILHALRFWYNIRSKEFGSANYEDYVGKKLMKSDDETNYSKFEKQKELELDKLHREYSRKKYYRARIELTNKTNISSASFPKAVKLEGRSIFESSPLLELEDICANPECDVSVENFLVSDEESYSDSLPSNYFHEDGFDNEKAQILVDVSPNIDYSKTENKPEDKDLFVWLSYFNTFNLDMKKQIHEFEKDQSKRDLRINLSRTLGDRINNCTIKNCSQQTLAHLLNFLLDLFNGRLVDGWSQGLTFNIDRDDQRQFFYAMAVVCDKYIEQLKWDPNVLDEVRLVIAYLCIKQPNFHKVFCAIIVESTTLLSFDTDRVLLKLNSFGAEAPQESASQWMNNELATFRLFCKVQTGLITDGDEICDVKGPQLIKMVFMRAMDPMNQIIICNLFVLSEILTLFGKQFRSRENRFGILMTTTHYERIRELMSEGWESHIQLNDKVSGKTKLILNSRHNYLTCILDNTLGTIFNNDFDS